MIDLERCTGCKSCEAACKQTNALGPHTYRNRVMWFEPQGGDDDTARLEFLTVTCQQCERPACLRACPVQPGAISKDAQSGVVSIDALRCTGCGECAVACPYGAIGYNPDNHHAVKCDLCASRRAQGSGPACASVCPTRAITFGPRSELAAHAQANQRDVLDTDHFLQQPATLYLAARPGADSHTNPDTNNAGKSASDKSLETPRIMRDHQVRRRLTMQDASAHYGGDATVASPAVPLASPPAAAINRANNDTQVVDGGCHICFNACPVQYHLQSGQITNVFGNPKDPVFQGRVCAKSQMTLQSYTGKGRLTQPLKRVGPPGSGEFVDVSWDTALDDIASRLKQVRSEHGSQALAIHAGSRTGTLNLLGFIPMFAALWGTKNTASTEPFCDLAKTVAMTMTQGNALLANVYTEDDIGSAALHVYIGDNQAETRPVNFGLVNQWRLARGARMVVVDPRMTPTASKADQWLAIRPGTDMALGLALIHEVFETDAQDHAFCDEWITGWQQWRDFICTRQYTPRWAEAITGINAAQIRALAADIARADGCMLYLSRGINQHSNAGQTNRVFMFLAAITGNWGRRGGGYFNVNAELDWMRPALPDDRIVPSPAAVSKNPAGWVPAMLGEAGYPVRALITGNNPLAQWPDQARTRRAFAGLDLLVHLELYKNATSAWADYVLPMATGIEKGGTTRFAEDRRVIWNDPLIAPPGNARSDHWFWIELGKRLGFEDILRDEYKNPAHFFDEVLAPATPMMHGVSTTLLKAQPARSVRVPLPEPGQPAQETLYLPGSTAFGQPGGKRFPTPSGTLEFYTPALEAQFASLGLSALPEFYGEQDQSIRVPVLRESAPVESPFIGGTMTRRVGIAHPVTSSDAQPGDAPAGSAASPAAPAPATKAAGVFDTDLVTGRPPAAHFHSWTHYFWQAQEMWPELYCQIHPDKAAAIGVADGDSVRVATSHGALTARAWLHRGIRRDAVFVPIGWDEFQPYHPAATVNHLTGLALDPVSSQANLKAHRCAVSRHHPGS